VDLQGQVADITAACLRQGEQLVERIRDGESLFVEGLYKIATIKIAN